MKIAVAKPLFAWDALEDSPPASSAPFGATTSAAIIRPSDCSCWIGRKGR